MSDLFDRQKRYVERYGLRSVGARIRPETYDDTVMLKQKLGVSLNDIIKCGILVYKQVLKIRGGDFEV